MKAKVFIKLKPSVMDPQGQTVKHALESLHYSGVDKIRIGKMIEVQWQGDESREKREAELKSMCDQLLANPVIEDYSWEFVESE